MKVSSVGNLEFSDERRRENDECVCVCFFLVLVCSSFRVRVSFGFFGGRRFVYSVRSMLS